MTVDKFASASDLPEISSADGFGRTSEEELKRLPVKK